MDLRDHITNLGLEGVDLTLDRLPGGCSLERCPDCICCVLIRLDASAALVEPLDLVRRKGSRNQTDIGSWRSVRKSIELTEIRCGGSVDPFCGGAFGVGNDKLVCLGDFVPP